jgi:hypothetical protein
MANYIYIYLSKYFILENDQINITFLDKIGLELGT